MGNFNITVRGVGIHQSGSPNDVEQMTARFIDQLVYAGHNVMGGTVTIGGEVDVLNRRSELLPITVPCGAPEPAQLAYERYAAATNGKTFDGRDMPKWEALGERIQNAWRAAIGA
jgi:hypothetical protein